MIQFALLSAAISTAASTTAATTSTAGGAPSSISKTIIGVIALAAIAYFVWTKLKDTKDPAKMTDFFNKIQAVIKTEIVNEINKIDFTKISSATQFEEYMTEFIKNLYNNLWNVCIGEVDVLYKDDQAAATVLKKALSKDTVEKYIETICSTEDIKTKIQEAFNTYLTTNLKASQDREAVLQAKLDAIDAGEPIAENAVQFTEDSVPAAAINDKVEPVQETIIPPTDEEQPISADDKSVEFINSDKE